MHKCVYITTKTDPLRKTVKIAKAKYKVHLNIAALLCYPSAIQTLPCFITRSSNKIPFMIRNNFEKNTAHGRQRIL